MLFFTQHIPPESSTGKIHPNTFESQILAPATTTTTGFKTQSTFSACKYTIMYIEIANHRSCLTSANNASPSSFGKTITYYYILRGFIDTDSIFSASGLHRKTVVSTIQRTILYQYISCRLDINAICTPMSVRVYRHTTYNHSIAIYRNYIPKK